MAQDLLARVARLPGDARRIDEADAQTLRIASTHALSFTFLPRWLRGLESGAPLGQVQLMSDVLAALRGADAAGQGAVRAEPCAREARGALDAEAYPSARVGEDELLPVSAPDARQRAAARAVVPSAAGAVLGYTEESGLGRILRAVLGQRLARASPRVVVTAHAASVLRTMALDGRGLAWLPATLVHDDLAAGRLVRAAPADWDVALEIRLYREREPLAQDGRGVLARRRGRRARVTHARARTGSPIASCGLCL